MGDDRSVSASKRTRRRGPAAPIQDDPPPLSLSSWEDVEGSPRPLGVSRTGTGNAYNFALYSKHAESVTLLLYTEDEVAAPFFTKELDTLVNKTGRVWHCRVPASTVRRACYYAYRVSGPESTGRFERHFFDPEKVLLDPSARAVHFPDGFDRTAAVAPGDNSGKAPLGVLHADGGFDWSGDTRPRHEHDLVIYELHVKGFTRHPSSGLEDRNRGTYRGLVDKIPYLADLGVTAVELMPVYQFDPAEGTYWGYMPLNFFSPHQAYSSIDDPALCRDEFRDMVKAFHEAGIEIILDVVYNHTCEGDERGPTYSFRGIDNSTYYLLSGSPAKPYLDFSGCGNSLHFANRHTRRLVVDSMRHWVNEMHVDGFRVDLASAAFRNPDGTINWEDPPIVGTIQAFPDLAAVRWIVEPWDAGGAYQLGRRFPGVYAWQWNGRFRDDVRRFVRGDPGLVPSMMTRVYGSDDLFPDDRMNAYHPYQSVNYICSHDGFCLYDLVSYNTKRNWANGEKNTDGPSDEPSWNCGWEGDEGVPSGVLRLRKQQVKNFCALLLLSNGTPMIRAGDEFMNTQFGNSNPHNQDNETSWLKWSLYEENLDVHRFFRNMIAFRKSHPSIARSRFWRDDVRWYGVGRDVDYSHDSHSFAWCLQGGSQNDDDIYVMINTYTEDLLFEIQEWSEGWERIVDTSLDRPEDIRDLGKGVPLTDPRYRVRSRSVAVLTRRPRD